jgi:hypothetical protein
LPVTTPLEGARVQPSGTLRDVDVRTEVGGELHKRDVDAFSPARLTFRRGAGQCESQRAHRLASGSARRRRPRWGRDRNLHQGRRIEPDGAISPDGSVAAVFRQVRGQTRPERLVQRGQLGAQGGTTDQEQGRPRRPSFAVTASTRSAAAGVRRLGVLTRSRPSRPPWTRRPRRRPAISPAVTGLQPPRVLVAAVLVHLERAGHRRQSPVGWIVQRPARSLEPQLAAAPIASSAPIESSSRSSAQTPAAPSVDATSRACSRSRSRRSADRSDIRFHALPTRDPSALWIQRYTRCSFGVVPDAP